jgi:hypothetical protein
LEYAFKARFVENSWNTAGFCIFVIRFIFYRKNSHQAQKIILNKWIISERKGYTYYEDTQKRTFAQKIRKIKNTVLMLMPMPVPQMVCELTSQA